MRNSLFSLWLIMMVRVLNMRKARAHVILQGNYDFASSGANFWQQKFDKTARLAFSAVTQAVSSLHPINSPFGYFLCSLVPSPLGFLLLLIVLLGSDRIGCGRSKTSM